MRKLPRLCWPLCSLLVIGCWGTEALPASEIEELIGKQTWFGNGCFRCHVSYPRAIEPVNSRFWAAHDPQGRDYLPGSIDRALLEGYAQDLTDAAIARAIGWSDAASRILEKK